MVKKIEVAGIQLDNYTVRESMMQVDKNISAAGLYTIEEVNMDMILHAGTDESLKKVLSFLNETIISENAILKAVNQLTMQRQHEIQDHTFFFELMKYLERNQKAVFLLGETDEETRRMQNFMLQSFPRMNICKMEILEQYTGEFDSVINDLNAEAPDAVVSILSHPRQENFLETYRDKISAGLWYGMGTLKPVSRQFRIKSFLQERVKIRALVKHILKYQEQEEIKNE